MESPMHTKFGILTCIRTLNMTTKNYHDRSTACDTSHISQIYKIYELGGYLSIGLADINSYLVFIRFTQKRIYNFYNYNIPFENHLNIH